MSDSTPHTRIKKLSPLLINQLAAGEVVTRPAAVVKELLENAIDAGATHIEIRITQGGTGLIEVADNGDGIHPDDMIMAITRHATSKVADVAHLHGIETLGFRGEALAATAAVSRLTLTSSHDDTGIGRQLHVAGVLEDTPTLTPVVHNRGTRVTVRDLYFNVPARRGNLKSIATEFAHIETIVREVALARADVTLSLYHDNKQRLLLSADADNTLGDDSTPRLPLSRLEQALGVVLTANSDNVLPIRVDLSSLLQQSTSTSNVEAWAEMSFKPNISGWLWSSSDKQETLPKLLYINGRLIKEPIISNQIRQLAERDELAAIGYALYFELPPQWLNLNVHPAKQRIKISSLNNIMAHLNHSVLLKLKALNRSTFTNTQVSTKPSIDQSDTFNSAYTVLPLSQQVQSNRQMYEHTNNLQQANDLSAQPLESTTDTSVPSAYGSQLNTVTHTLSATQDDDTSLINSYHSLPYCLDVVDTFNHDSHVYRSTKIQAFEAPSDLVWLLFYHKSQLQLISQQDWQTHFRLMFAADRFKVDNWSTKAAVINQQLANMAAQMSTPDFIAFIADLETLLNNHSSTTTDSQQLIAFMLSSKAK